MTNQATSIAKRLSQAGSPLQRQRWEEEDGYYAAACRVSHADIPALIEIACKWRNDDWQDSDSDLVGNSKDIELLPVTAWRTLADLRSAESIEPLIDMVSQLDGDDQFALEDLPHVFGKIGEPAIKSLVRLANDARKQEFVRIIATESLQRVAAYHPECRSEVVRHLMEMMTRAAEIDIHVNSSVLVGLVDLKAAEAAEAIERAFSSNRIDVGMLGDWEEVRKILGVEGLQLPMPKNPFNCDTEFRSQMGIGIFSEEPVFDEDGPVTDEQDAYYNRAWELFSKSKEAEQVIERFGGLHWFSSFLEFGIQYRGEVVDQMTPASVKDYIYDYVVRKVSTKPDSAAALILELTKFWEYVQRVFELPAANSIIAWLKTDGLEDELRTELANPENFGMAKSFVKAGTAAGYDMSSQQGMAQFMAAYNQRLLPPAEVPRSGTIFPQKTRVGRNDPCPCGSGKKFKKCCLRGS